MAGLFGGKKTEDIISALAGEIDVVDTIIGRDASIKGTVTAKGMVRIDGKFEGEVRTEGDIVIAEGAYVVASVFGKNLIVAGELYGNVDITEKLEITSAGKLLGDVKLASFVIGDGGVFKGNCTMLSVAEEDAPVPEISPVAEEAAGDAEKNDEEQTVNNGPEIKFDFF